MCVCVCVCVLTSYFSKTILTHLGLPFCCLSFYLCLLLSSLHPPNGMQWHDDAILRFWNIRIRS